MFQVLLRIFSYWIATAERKKSCYDKFQRTTNTFSFLKYQVASLCICEPVRITNIISKAYDSSYVLTLYSHIFYQVKNIHQYETSSKFSELYLQNLYSRCVEIFSIINKLNILWVKTVRTTVSWNVVWWNTNFKYHCTARTSGVWHSFSM